MPVVDTLFWLLAAFVACRLHGDAFTSPAALTLLACAAVAGIVSLCLGYLWLLTYRRRYPAGSFEEATAVAAQFGVSALVMLVVAAGWAAATGTPLRTLTLSATFALALLAALTVRFAARLVTTYQASQYYQRVARDQAPIVVVGAGRVGEQIIHLTKFDAASPFTPVGLVDDDPAKRNLRILGVPVSGTVDDLIDVCTELSAATVVIAVADFPAERLKQVTTGCAEHGIRVMTIVPVRQLTNRALQISDIREIDLAEVLGRREIHTDVSQIAGYLSGRTVLVTGAGGSIGSELARQIHGFGPKELVMLDRDESALHSVQLDIYGKGLLDTRDMVLCDIRDRDALEAVFAEHRPEVVFHAAALKHLPMLEMYPEEGWKTNVLGSRNVIDLALRYDVQTLVNISTDKAADPTSVLGRTKLLAERMTTATALECGRRFVSVRFGNVLGSRGSMLWTFKRQIEEGGPITVTHPDVERFFMTIPEACQLVLQAGSFGRPGDTMVLDMGEPVKIVDVARRLVAQSGKDIRIEFTGLRPGEKLSEDLVGHSEHGERPFHPLVSHVRVQEEALQAVEELHAWAVGEDPLEGKAQTPPDDAAVRLSLPVPDSAEALR
ncbi:polysaccharide biosynthesis protein [Actinomyces ruminicola]|uniref:NDP-sugar epimerase, includes UDP-GlcNAc-inverting 4,6-dehydratase FlaA1 and capsular polysaccharide biosynthesis protein EpsC n=1 Tax=Actinomyces ruminicola TaxID=332524 RepID=A0A1G9TWY0_9ACTO|nr:nucleoside-diphosphate sugar epimerase/dehydratase [Actinomyces ruminicola]SDM52207.1 NDP-sugar epimerase, includes UDP-GlcNAc-inverting 4,6-dehydratase FlaA1 and capsular polysaccharide biosynthesis protein EpsC [Actinomyces ruminicola]